jgi:hypothetical protein
MPLPTAPLINGYRYSWASIELSVQSLTNKPQVFVDIQSLDWSETLEIAFMRGTSRAPIGWTSGQYTPEDLSLKLGKSSFSQMITQMGPGWLGLNILLAVTYADIGEPLTVDGFNCRIAGRADSNQQGPDPLTTTVKLKPIQITTNGIPSLLNRVF